MCRTGGRRCPTSIPRTPEQREAYNAKRRAQYAAKKAEREKLKQQSVSIQENHDKKEKLITPIKLIPGGYRELPPAEEKDIKTPDDYGFPTNTDFEFEPVPQKAFSVQDQILSEFSSSQEEAVRNYINDELYEAINTQLREEKGAESIDEDSDDYLEFSAAELKQTIVNLDELLDNLPQQDSRVVYRGVQGIEREKLLSLEKGSAIDFDSYTSTSTQFSVAKSFANNDYELPQDQNKVILEMMTDKGLYISGPEQEIIIPRNTRWRVVGNREVDYIMPSNFNSINTKVTVIQLVQEELA